MELGDWTLCAPFLHAGTRLRASFYVSLFSSLHRRAAVAEDAHQHSRRFDAADQFAQESVAAAHQRTGANAEIFALRCVNDFFGFSGLAQRRRLRFGMRAQSRMIDQLAQRAVFGGLPETPNIIDVL